MYNIPVLILRWLHFFPCITEKSLTPGLAESSAHSATISFVTIECESQFEEAFPHIYATFRVEKEQTKKTKGLLTIQHFLYGEREGKIGEVGAWEKGMG